MPEINEIPSDVPIGWLDKIALEPDAAIGAVTAYPVTSKEVSGGTAYVDVGSTAAAEIAAVWKVGWRIVVAVSPTDANYNGVTRFTGVVGNRVSFVRIGGGSTQALTACTGTVQLDIANPKVPYSPANGGSSYVLTTNSIPWDQGSDGDNQGMNNADLYLRPSAESKTAIHIQRPNGAGADTGYPVIIGKRNSSAWQWLSDGHTIRRFSNNGQSHNENSYGSNVQPWHTVRYPSRGAHANGSAFLAATSSLTTITTVLCLGTPVDGVYMISGGATSDVQSTTDPASLAIPPRVPSALASGSTNNYSPGVGHGCFFTADAGGSTLTGMVAGANGEMRWIHVLGGSLTFANESASSTDVNRFTNSTGSDHVCAVGSLVLAVYRSATSRWYLTKVV